MMAMLHCMIPIPMERNDLAPPQADARGIPADPGGRHDGDDAAGSVKSAARHSRTSTRVLKQWFSAHLAWPYPDQAEKERLSNETAMSVRQVATWFVNARRRNGAKLARLGLPSSTGAPLSSSLTQPAPFGSDFGADGCAVFSAGTLSASPVQPSDMTPLDRWRHTPPQEEPVSMQAVADAAEKTRDTFLLTTGDGPAPEWHPAPASLSSLDFSSSSASCSSSAFSKSSASASNSLGSLDVPSSRRGPRRRSKLNRRRAGRPIEDRGDGSRPYQCTFCTDSFKSRYDWTRHEASLHLILEKWTCLLLGPRSRDPARGNTTVHCVLCGEPDPTDGHLASHRVANCTAKPPSARTFLRKDHLRQHLRFAHGVDGLTDWMDAWKSKELNIRSRCGFCGERFTTWPERNDHLADHFRAGALMKDWTGCRGLDPSVALLVENAMPPYLIGLEATDPDPFSASKGTTKQILAASSQEGVHNERPRRAPTSFESLTARMGDYVRIAREHKLDLSDEALRRQARFILYDDDDPWNHTPADNPQWLDMFKLGYGLGDPGPSRHDSLDQSGAADLRAAEDAGSMGKEASPFTWERLQHAAGSDAAMLQPHLGYLSGEGPAPGMLGSDVVVPWSWQTPECLAEFSQLCPRPGAAVACGGGVSGFGIDPGLLENACTRDAFPGLDGVGKCASGTAEDALEADEAVRSMSFLFDQSPEPI